MINVLHIILKIDNFVKIKGVVLFVCMCVCVKVVLLLFFIIFIKNIL